MCWFWFRWHGNYIWICSNIFKFVYNNTASFIQSNYFLLGLERSVASKV
jgi:hypothetical protein